jgi:hypothetical protein
MSTPSSTSGQMRIAMIALTTPFVDPTWLK